VNFLYSLVSREYIVFFPSFLFWSSPIFLSNPRWWEARFCLISIASMISQTQSSPCLLRRQIIWSLCSWATMFSISEIFGILAFFSHFMLFYLQYKYIHINVYWYVDVYINVYWYVDVYINVYWYVDANQDDVIVRKFEKIKNSETS